MSDIWTKALRGGPSQATPRGKSYSNNRYGSKGATDDEDSADSALKRTPRQAGMYDRPWKDLSSLSSTSRSGTPRSRTYARPPIPRQNGNTDDNDTASIAESDDVSVATEDDFRDGMQEGESVQVFVRVRPINSAEAAEGDQYDCTRIYGDRTVSVDLKHRAEPYQFKFDCVLPESTTQQEIFERAGKPIVDNCMGGYNSTIFAYGQTGAGKTYTMQGPLIAALQEDSDERGLAPRVFEYLFAEIDRAQDEQCHGHLTFTCRCSMLEIYNEVITDLLNPAATNLQIREDIKRGCYVEDLSEQLVQNVSDAMRLMRTGAENRHVGETRLNRESSRSHSVFTCTLERHSKSEETGVTNVLFSRLNLIDLAGSERIHGGEHGGSQATGKHFKEACHINKSLTTLGRVIMELVEAQRSASGAGRPQSAGGPNGRPSSLCSKPRHVPYRDSRLTFLLQDSLGGNAKTLMVANISPSSVSAQETLSTLSFMSRAKCIRNRATINLDARGDVVLLQREIVRLNCELDNLRKGYTEPAIQENKELRQRLEEMCTSKGQMEALLLGLEKENQNLKVERRRLDHKMSQIQKGAGQLDQAIFSLTAKVMHHESLAAAATEKSLAAAQAEHDLQLLQMQRAADELRTELDQERTVRKETELRLQEELRDSVSAAAQQVQCMQGELQNVHATIEDLKTENDQLREQLTDTRARQQEESEVAAAVSAALQQQLDNAAAQAAALQVEATQLTSDRADLQQQLDKVLEQNEALQEELQHRIPDLQKQVEEAAEEQQRLQQQLATASRESADSHQQLEESLTRAEALQQQLEAVTESRDEALEALEVSKTVNSDLNEQIKQLMEQLTQAESKIADGSLQIDAANSSISALQQQLEVASSNLALTQQQIANKQQEVAAGEQGMHQLQQQLEQKQEQLQEAQQQIQESDERVSDLLNKTTALEQQVQELESRNSMASCSNEDLQQQIAAVTAAAAASKAANEAAVQELQQKIEEQQAEAAARQQQIAALEVEVSDLQDTLKDRSQALDASQEQCKGLQQQLELSTAAATARADQLSHDLAAARESSKSRQEELMKQVTEVHLQLSAAQQEQERLQDELDGARSDHGLLQAQLADLQAQLGDVRGQASQKAMDCDLLRKKLAAEETTMISLKSELLERDDDIDDLRQQLQKAEALGQDQQEKAAEELGALQRDLMDANELLTSHGFEAQQMQRRLEEMVHRLSDKTAAVDAHKEEVKSLKSTVVKMEVAARKRDALLAERTALSEQLQDDVEAAQAHINQLQEELASKEGQLRNKINANELQLKEQIVYNARNRQAMNEIRKVINWAQQAPTTAVGTAASTGSPHIERPSSRHSRQHRQQQPVDMAEEGYGSRSSSSGGGRTGDTASCHLSAGLPGQLGHDCLPLMLEADEVGMLAGSASLLGAKRRSDQGSEGRPSMSGDGTSIAVAGDSRAKLGGASHTGRHAGRQVSDVDVSVTDAGLQDGSCDYQDGLYPEDSKGDVDCPRQLLIPEQASSPLRMSTEDSPRHLASPKQRCVGGSSRNSRRGTRDASRKGGLRAGSDHFSFGALKRHSIFNKSEDSITVLSVSGEWAASHDHQQPDMKLPSNIVGDCDTCE